MKTPQSVYDRARKRVEELKGFYNHLKIYIVANVLLIVAKFSLSKWISHRIDDPDIERWLDINVYITPLLWGLVLLVHGIYAYRHKFRFIKKWEDKKLQEILDKEKNNE